MTIAEILITALCSTITTLIVNHCAERIKESSYYKRKKEEAYIELAERLTSVLFCRKYNIKKQFTDNTADEIIKAVVKTRFYMPEEISVKLSKQNLSQLSDIEVDKLIAELKKDLKVK